MSALFQGPGGDCCDGHRTFSRLTQRCMQVVMCSGIDTQGSIRIVRNGIGMLEHSAAEMPGIRGMWNLRPSFSATHDELLVITFVSDTRVLQLSIDDELGEADMDCFDTEAQVNMCLSMQRQAETSRARSA